MHLYTRSLTLQTSVNNYARRLFAISARLAEPRSDADGFFKTLAITAAVFALVLYTVSPLLMS